MTSARRSTASVAWYRLPTVSRMTRKSRRNAAQKGEGTVRTNIKEAVRIRQAAGVVDVRAGSESQQQEGKDVGTLHGLYSFRNANLRKKSVFPMEAIAQMNYHHPHRCIHRRRLHSSNGLPWELFPIAKIPHRCKIKSFYFSPSCPSLFSAPLNFPWGMFET